MKATPGHDFIQIFNPNNLKELYLAKELDGSVGELVFEVAHRNPSVEVYWHIDDQFVGITNHFHQLEVAPSVGKHTLTVVDEFGETIVKNFTVLE